MVVRFLSDNPGTWFLHCHIDLHNTNGMGMVINEAPDRHPKAPPGFPVCANFYNNGSFVAGNVHVLGMKNKYPLMTQVVVGQYLREKKHQTKSKTHSMGTQVGK